MKCINKIKIALPVFAAVCLFFCGCDSRDNLKDAYQIYATSDAYQLTESLAAKPVELFAEDLCVGGTANSPAGGVDDKLAEAAAVFTVADGEVAYAKNIYEKLYPASTTKILTAYLALKYGDLDDVMTVSHEAVNSLMPGSSICGLKEGDQIRLGDALYGLMLPSGNDAANVIAEHISGSTEEFAELMNREAAALGATKSHFVNAHGLPDDDHYTTAYDLYLIFQAAVQNEDFVRYISTKEISVTYTDKDGKPVEKKWKNTNGYLAEKYDVPANVTVVGGKTGTTEKAGHCLVLLSENAEKKPVISVVLRSKTNDDLYQFMTDILTNFSK